MHKVKEVRLGKDIIFDSHIMVLISEDKSGDVVFFPIWIGPFEGECLKLAMSDEKSNRPTTYDTMVTIISELDASFMKVTITEMKKNTFYASLEILSPVRVPFKLDIRPSDAVNIALRCGINIYISDKVIKQSINIEAIENFRKLMESNKREDESLLPKVSNKINIDKINPKDFDV